MAEGLLRARGHGRYEAFSAGTEATSVRPEAISVMSEIGIDIAGNESKTLDRYVREPFSWVITVCDSARQACPVFPGAERSAHWRIADPTEVDGSEAERLAAFRAARDDLDARIRAFVAGEVPAAAT
jgi:arsenate reductase (thioredoxin)